MMTNRNNRIEPVGNETHVDDEAYDQELAELISKLGDEVSRGGVLDLEDVCRQYARFASDLRMLWGTVILTQAASVQRTREDSVASDESSIAAMELPMEFGDYRLEHELGRGGMGIVYKAIRRSDNKPVAIKMILKGDFASPAERKRFQAEAEAVAHLEHPNIVPIYEFGEHQGLPFLCMKLIEGQTLSQRLLQGPLPARRAAQLLHDIGQAVDYAHDHGVLHRDLKPSNILLDTKGNAYVADFGLAKRAAAPVSLTKSGAILGTPSYMSPEQAAGAREQVNAVSDVYSLGAILYHAMTGRPPFLGETPVETVMMVLEQDPIPPRVLNRRVNRDLEMIAMCCLQKPKDLRYESAGMLAQDLASFLKNKPISAREGRFAQVIANLFRETHHAGVLENWGVIWMWHSLALLVASVVTQVMFQYQVRGLEYVVVWTLGFGAWAAVFWWLRRRMGPVTFVERQIAHVWAASMCLVAFLFPLEVHLGLEPLSLAPLLGVVTGMTFVVKAGILSGWFYIHAFILFATAVLIALYPDYAIVKFGFVSAGCFFVSGLKYYRRRKDRSMLPSDL